MPWLYTPQLLVNNGQDNAGMQDAGWYATEFHWATVKQQDNFFYLGCQLPATELLKEQDNFFYLGCQCLLMEKEKKKKKNFYCSNLSSKLGTTSRQWGAKLNLLSIWNFQFHFILALYLVLSPIHTCCVYALPMCSMINVARGATP